MATVQPPRLVFDRDDSQRRVRHPLQAVRGFIRRYVLLEGLGVAVIYLALAFWLGLAVDFGLFYFFAFDWVQELQLASDPGSNTTFLVRLVVLLVFLGGLFLVVLLQVGLRYFREFSDPAVALVLERRFPAELGDRLITAVEIADPALAKQYGYSQRLVDRTIEDAAERVEKLPVSQVFDWARLKKLWLWALALTVGMFVACWGVYAGVTSATQEEPGPLAFPYRFADVGSIWVERNLLLMDSYWPRKAYLEVVRFQDTAGHPNEMRVGRDEQRPNVQVRAVRWVVADRATQGGWRPLRWQDLRELVPAEERLEQIPADWPGWIIDLDDLDPSIPSGVLPASWQGKTSGEIRQELFTPAVQQSIKAASAEQAVIDLLDWHTWTVDKLEQQDQKPEVRRALRAEFPVAYKALEGDFSELEILADSPSMSRRLRKLAIPQQVQVYYRGKSTKSSSSADRQEDNKYAIGLNELKESVRFTVRGEDYYTPPKLITLVPPPSLTQLSLDKEEPAYIYYRVQGPQSALKGKKQIFSNLPVSVTGELSTLQVPLGTNLTLTAKADRKLKGGVRIKAPAQAEERGAVLPVVDVLMKEDQQTFVTKFPNVTRTLEFNFEFNDEDNVKGKRRILIKPVDDRAPEVFDMEMTVVLRKPRFRAEPGKAVQASPADGFLITPDALIPFKGTIRDDYGLDKAGWAFEVEQIDLELVGQGLPSLGKEKDRLPTLVLQGSARERRNALVVSGLQLLPGTPSWNLASPPYLVWMTRVLQVDLARKRSEGEETLYLERFVERQRQRADAGEEVPPKNLPTRITDKIPQRGLFKEHTLKEEEGFDFKKYLTRLKVQDPTRQAQLHYQVRLSVAATDNNVETGPGTGRNKAPVNFLVVSENELLAQVFLEEEVLRDRLEKAYQKLKNGKTSLDEQSSKLAFPGSDLGLIAIRIDELRKGLADAASMTREVSTDYGRILKELEANRVKRSKLTDVEYKIVRPLEDIVEPNFGNFTVTEEANQKLYQGLDDDLVNLKRAETDSKILPQLQKELETNRPGHLTRAREVGGHLDRLMERINSILIAMDDGIAESQLLQIIVEIERDQRKTAETLRIFHDQRVADLLNELLNPAPQKKTN